METNQPCSDDNIETKIKLEPQPVPCSPHAESNEPSENIDITKTGLESQCPSSIADTEKEEKAESFVLIKTEVEIKEENESQDNADDCQDADSSNLSSDKNEVSTIATDDDHVEDKASSSIKAEQVHIENETPTRRTCYEGRTNGIIAKTSGHVRKRTDEFEVFSKFVAQELRSLRSQANKRLLKRTIQKAVLQVSELDDKKK